MNKRRRYQAKRRRASGRHISRLFGPEPWAVRRLLSLLAPCVTITANINRHYDDRFEFKA